MLYDNYEKKIKKVAKAKNFVLKYKIIILSFLGLLIISLGTFIGLKGLFTNNLVINDITYGEEVSISRKPSVLLSDYIIEYQKDGADAWSELKPYEAGYYEARAVSNGIFGKRYSSNVKFEIKKASVSYNLKLENIFYGDLPKINFKLVNDDKIVEDSYYITYEKFEESVAYGTIHLENLKIIDKNNKDVTSSYSIQDKLEFSVDYKPQELFVLLDEIKDFEYDNQEFSKEKIKYKLNKQLLDGEELVFDYEITSSDNSNYTKKVLDADIYTLSLKNVKVMNGNLDVSENYIIHTKDIKFKVLKKNLIIKTNDAKKEYDSIALEDLNISSEGLLLTHNINILSSSLITNVGKITNKIEVEVLDKDNVNVSHNYNIIYEYGSLEILKRNVNIKLLSLDNKIYDGISVSYIDEFNNFILLDNTSLVKNENLKLVVEFVADNMAFDSVINANTYKLQVKEYITENLDLNNYDINYIYDDFIISKRSLTISPKDINNRIYDQNEFVYKDECGDIPKIIDGSLVNDTTIKIDVLFFVDNTESICKNVDDYVARISQFTIYNDLESNYDIKLEEVSFKITPLDLEVIIEDYITTYNGEIFDDNKITYQTNIKVNELEFTYEFINSAGKKFKEVEDADTYNIKVTSVNIIDDLIKNYNFIILDENSTLTIKKAYLKITPSTKLYSKVYDGTVYKHDGYEILDGYIFGDDKIIATEFKYYANNDFTKEVEPLNANSYKYACTNFEYINTLSTNYDIVVEFSELEILKREVTVKILNCIKEYDGIVFEYEKSLNNFEYDINTRYELVKGESITLDVSYYQYGEVVLPKNAGIYDLKVKDIIYNNALESNYRITVNDGILEITSREITIELKEADAKIYDGNKFIYHNEYIVTKGSILENEKIFIHVKYRDIITDEILDEIVNANKYEVIVDYFTVENTLLSNYNIEVSTVIVEILKVKLTVSPVNISDKVFDYLPLDYYETYYNRAFIVKGKLVNNDKLEINVKFIDDLISFEFVEPLDVNTYYAIIVSHYFTEGLDSNYEVIYQNDKEFEITKKTVNVQISDDSKEYDGTSYDSRNVNFVCDDELLDGILDITFNFLQNSEVIEPINAGKYNIVAKNIYLEKFNINNFIFKFNGDATLTIDRRNVSVKLVAKSKMYDGTAYNNLDFVVTSSNFIGDDNIVIEGFVARNLATNQIEVPINVSNYLLEITSYRFIKGLESNYNICLESANLEILKRSIRIKIDDYKKVYDGNIFIYDNSYSYLPESLKLLNDDQIKINVKYLVNNLEVSPVDAKKYKISLLDIEGLNGTNIDNYQFEVFDGTLDIMQRDLNITLNNITKEYDGNYLEYNNYNIEDGNLILDHQLELKFKYYNLNYGYLLNIKDAGIYDVSIAEFNIINGNKDNYKINYDSVSIEILRRKVTLTNVVLENVEYNGREYLYSDYYGNNYQVIDGSLVDGESIIFEVKFVSDIMSNYYVRAINVGTYYAKLSVRENNINLSNYEFTFIENSELVIYKTDLIIDFKENSKVYDGMPFSEYDIKYDIISKLNPIVKFKFNYSLDNQILEEIINANVYKLNVISYELLNDLKENYNIMINTNNIVITPSKIVVTPTSDDNKIYDGLSYICEDIHIEGIVGVNDIIKARTFNYYKDGILVDSIIDASTYYIEVVSLDFVNVLASNYIVDLQNRIKFEVLKRQINIKPKDINKVFDNKEVTFERIENNFEYLADSLRLVNDDALILDIFSANNEEMINSGIYEINANYSFIRGLATNYDVIISNALLTIDKLDVEISVNEFKDKIYDGISYVYENEEFKISEVTNINSNDIFTISLYFKTIDDIEVVNILGADTYYISRFDVNFISGNSNNYNISVKNIDYSFTISKYQLTVKTYDEEVIYEGYDKPFETKKIYHSNIISTDSIYFIKTRHHFVGRYQNEVSVVITNKDIDVTNSYDILYEFGYVTINKRDLHINYGSEYKELVYGYDVSQLELQYDILDKIEEIDIASSWTFFDYDTNEEVEHIFLIGHYKLRLLIDNIIYNGINVSENYNVIINDKITTDIYKEIVVSKREMRFESSSQEFEYNLGNPLFSEEYYQVNLAALDHIIIDNRAEISIPGSVENILEYHIVRGDVDVTHCYDITNIYGTLYIDNNLFVDKIKVATYSGEEFSNNYEVIPLSIKNKEIKDLSINIIFRDYLKDELSQKLKNAGLYLGIVDSYEIKYTGTYFESEEDINNYINSYDVHLDNINLEINKYKLELKAKNIEKVYDGKVLEDSVNNYEIIGENVGISSHIIEVKTEIKNLVITERTSMKYQILDVNIYDELGEDVTSNYEVIKGSTDDRENKKYMGYARILPRKVYLKTGSISKVYDGKTLSCNEVEIFNTNEIDTGLLAGHTWEIELDSCVLTRPGKKQNRVHISIFDSNNKDVTNNYRLDYSYSDGYLEYLKA